jgi:hypothetical protein
VGTSLVFPRREAKLLLESLEVRGPKHDFEGGVLVLLEGDISTGYEEPRKRVHNG